MNSDAKGAGLVSRHERMRGRLATSCMTSFKNWSLCSRRELLAEGY